MPAYEYTVRVVTFDPRKHYEGQPTSVAIDERDMLALGWTVIHTQWESDHCAITYRRLKMAYLGLAHA